MPGDTASNDMMMDDDADDDDDDDDDDDLFVPSGSVLPIRFAGVYGG